MLRNGSEDQLISWSVNAVSKNEKHPKDALSAWKLGFFHTTVLADPIKTRAACRYHQRRQLPCMTE